MSKTLFTAKPAKITLRDGSMLSWTDPHGKNYCLYVKKDDEAEDPLFFTDSLIGCWDKLSNKLIFGNTEFQTEQAFWQDLVRQTVPDSEKPKELEKLAVNQAMGLTAPYVAWRCFWSPHYKALGTVVMLKEVWEKVCPHDYSPGPGETWKQSAARLMRDDVARYNNYLDGKVYKISLCENPCGAGPTKFSKKLVEWTGFYGDSIDDVVQGLRNESYTEFAEAVAAGKCDYRECR